MRLPCFRVENVWQGQRGKGWGRGAKRHRKVLRDNIQGLRSPQFAVLPAVVVLRAHLRAQFHEETRGVLKVFLKM